MAKQTDGFLGGFSGRLGAAIGYQWNGKWCVRSKPGIVHNPQTDKQMEHRHAFRRQVQLAAAMRDGVMAGMTVAARSAGMTAYNLFVSINQPAFGAADGAGWVDYQALQVSVGPLAPVGFGRASVDEHNVLSVRFESNPLHMQAASSDWVHLFVYCPDLESGILTAPAYRYAKKLSFCLPDQYAGHELHVYGFVRDNEGRCSYTSYIICGDEAVQEASADGNHAADTPTPTQDEVADNGATELSTEQPPNNTKVWSNQPGFC